MSIALESNNNDRIDRSGYVHGMKFKSIYDPADSGRFTGDRMLKSSPAVVSERADEADSCSSSSIGKNSDVTGGSSDGEDGAGDGEVQSSFKGPLDCLDSLEEVLPVKRGISAFYSGKSKSFTSLADVSSCSSVKEIAKKEDVYTRKRKNLLAHNNYFDKRLANSSRSSLALSAMINNNSERVGSNSSSPSPCLPPLPPHNRRSKSPNNESPPSPPTPDRKFAPWRSFSLSDLQHAETVPKAPTVLAIDKRSVD